jgi:tRNA modification GTPase
LATGAKEMKNDTIVAISTPLGEGGIGIVRLSGPESFTVVRKIFNCSKNSEPGYPKSRYLYYGTVQDLEGESIDEALVSFMPAPHTYTREDLVEINCHSGIINLRAVLKILLAMGIRLAEPGEFTKRAFLNGRIDLSQAEAVIGLIRARSEVATKASLQTLQGKLAEAVNDLRSRIIVLRAPIEAEIDYPEEFIDQPPFTEVAQSELLVIKDQLEALLKGVKRNRAYQEGVAVAIVGQPNVGKSSLLNRLLGDQKAIVHELPGTTRDLLEGSLTLGGYPLRLVDTAGIQESADPVELEGIKRARSVAAEAQLMLLVIDGSLPLESEMARLIPSVNGKQRLVVIINKSDLPQSVTADEVKKQFGSVAVVSVSALHGAGISLLEQAVAAELDQYFGDLSDSPILITFRQEEILNEALLGIRHAEKAILSEPAEITSLILKEVWLTLGQITGDTAGDDLLDRVFSEFCLGK